jgi:hypothetical protein
MDQEDFRISKIQASPQVGQESEAARIAAQYLAAANARDIEAIGKTLHPDLHFVGPAIEVHSRDSFLETYHKVFAHLEKLDKTAESLADNQVFYKYYMTFPAPIGPVQGTMKMTHAGNGLIKKIELVSKSRALDNYFKRPK